jgi:spoIIIJ-associated protein
MEWVETTGSSVEEAKEAALDQLGVDETDAEFDVLEEAKSGLFGRLRQEARVRARVRPTTPRPKVDRRDRKRRSSKEDDGGSERTADESTSSSRSGAGGGRSGGSRQRGRGRGADEQPAPKREKAPASRARATNEGTNVKRVDDDVDEVPLEEQAETVREFLDGLVEAFGASGRTEVEEVDEDTLEARVVGDDLGLLIGPKGQTLAAVQELARTTLMKGAGRGARLRVDVGGYRERRREALERFARQVAEQVLETGEATALEPMSPPDRKVVHDTVNTIDGVSTVSEGEDARRRVVILPDDEE